MSLFMVYPPFKVDDGPVDSDNPVYLLTRELLPTAPVNGEIHSSSQQGNPVPTQLPL